MPTDNKAGKTKKNWLLLIIGLALFIINFVAYFIFRGMNSELAVSFTGFGMLGGLVIALFGYFVLMIWNLKYAKAVAVAAGKAQSNKTLFPYGLILLVCAFTLNTSFMVLGILGYLRELTRFSTILGAVLLAIGAIQVLVNVGRKLMARKDDISKPAR